VLDSLPRGQYQGIICGPAFSVHRLSHSYGRVASFGPCSSTDAPVSAYAGILIPRTSTTGAERNARFARTVPVGGEAAGRSCAPSKGCLAGLDVKIYRQASYPTNLLPVT